MSQNLTQKQFKHKGKTYYGIKKGHKVNVLIEQTAKEQRINIGCYDINANSWQNNSRQYKIPEIVKRGFELAFGEQTA